VKKFPQGGVQGAQGPLIQIWDAHVISETTGARKLKLKTQLDVIKYSFRVWFRVQTARWRPRDAGPPNISKYA